MNLIGRWYAKDASRYYQIVGGKSVTAYKMYVHEIKKDKYIYDSFLLITDGYKEWIEQSKVNRESELKFLLEEIEAGHLLKEKPCQMNLIKSNIQSAFSKIPTILTSS
jgi:hypothetical protein